MAIQRVRPIVRDTYSGSLTQLLLDSEVETPLEAVLHFQEMFFEVSLDQVLLGKLADFLRTEIGSDDLRSSKSILEEPLRKVLHNMLSLPEYQLG